jgi:cell division protein FtsZ
MKVVETPVEFEFEFENQINEEATDIEDVPVLSSLKMREEEQLLDEPVYMDLGSNLNEITSVKVEEVPAASLMHKEEPVISDRPNRNELLARNKEREMRIREFTIKLKTPNGLSELENEPAYARKKITFESAPHSADSNISRY